MDKPIPFFYYDILSRIIPGAVTIAALLIIRDKLPQSWWDFFGGQQSWKAVIVPLMVGGVCYVIGVIYEVTDYLPGIGRVVMWSDDKAFRRAWDSLGEYVDKRAKLLEGKKTAEMTRYKFQMWDKLVFTTGRDPGLTSVFAHCHRFQAEHKMFLHLMYPTILFCGIFLARGMPVRACACLLLVFPTLFYFSHRRNVRRWLQALSSCKELNLIKNGT